MYSVKHLPLGIMHLPQKLFLSRYTFFYLIMVVYLEY